MDWRYRYTPTIWPVLASAAFMTALALYAWRRRSEPGALPFALIGLFASLWAVGIALELAAVEGAVRIFWSKFAGLWLLPLVTARLWFALEYAGLSRRLPRGALALLILPLLLNLLLVLTNDVHRWMWLGFSFEGIVRPIRGIGNWILTGYGYFLALTAFLVFVRLFVHSPLYRRPIVLILCGQLLTMVGYGPVVVGARSLASINIAILAAVLSTALYAYALFRFRVFDPIPVARETVIDQMREGMLVLDTQEKIAGVNRAAEEILGMPAARLRGRDVCETLPGWAELRPRLAAASAGGSEISLERGNVARQYALYVSPLNDRRGLVGGSLVLLHDVTEQKRAQAQLVEQQRALATLTERERLARELHDSLGQVLGYASFQVEAARKLIGDGQTAVADTQLARLAGIVRDAHADVRQCILDLRAAPSAQQPFLAALRRYLDGFTQNYGIRTGLTVAAGLDDGAFAPDTQMQLFRIMQEALANTRKHGDAKCIQVTFEARDRLACMTIQDDGCGFDPAQTAGEGGGRFGLRFMAERAEQLGGSLRVHSVPGAGTWVVVEVPRG